MDTPDQILERIEQPLPMMLGTDDDRMGESSLCVPRGRSALT